MKPEIKRELIFAVLGLLFILALFLRTSTAVIVEDLVREFAVPTATLALMSSAFFYAYSLVQLPVGMLSDRIGIRLTVVVSGLLGVGGTVLFAFSPGIEIATTARVLTGIGTAGIWVPALKYLSMVYSPDIFATRTTIISTIGSLGLLFATLPLVILVEQVGWRYSFAIVAAVLLLFILLAWLLMGLPSPSKPTPEKSAEQRKRSGMKIETSVYSLSFLRYGPFWLFVIWAFLVYGVQFSFQGLWGAIYLQDSFGISREAAGGHLFYTSLGLLVGGIFWGLLSDLIFRARKPVLFIATLGMLSSWIIMILITSYPGEFLTSLLYFCLGFFSVVFLVNFSCVKELFPIENAGTALGAANTMMLLGAGIFQGITGYMIDILSESGDFYTAYRTIFFFYLVSIILAMALILFMPETFPKHKKSDPV